MYRTFLCLLLVFSLVCENESQQIQMEDEGPLTLTGPIGPAEQLAELQRNVSSLWTYIYDLRGAVTHHLNHLRQHQVEMENAIHRLEHHGDGGHGDSHSASHTEGHSHSGEDHAHGSSQHSHSGEDHHHHSGEHHSHSGEHHSHGGDEHSHGGDSHSHGGDSHSHSDEHQSHGHYHDSHSHSHSDGDHAHGHEESGHHHDHKDSHENADDLQQTAQVSEPLVEPVIVPTTRQSHNHHHHHSHSHVSSSTTPSSSAFQPLNVMGEAASHHHSHHTHTISNRNRNRTVIMPKYSEYDLYELAVCNVQPNRAIPAEQQQNIVGQISLWQKKIGGSLNIHVRLSGFDMGDHHAHHQQQQQQEEDNEPPMVHKHGFHIHSSGDLSNGCQSTGPHYNPKDMNHGGPKALVRHVGDLGNIECDDHGVSNLVFSDDVASLKGPYSIVGKSMVIHSGQDDFGLGNNDESLRTGNAGTRLACCVIQKVDKLPIRSYRAVKTATQYQNW